MKRFIYNILMTCVAMTATAQEPDSASFYMPLIFNSFKAVNEQACPDTASIYKLDAGDQWLRDAMSRTSRYNQTRQDVMIANPGIVSFNASTLPEPPQEYAIKADPSKALLSVIPTTVAIKPEEKKIEEPTIKIHNWLHEFKASAHFSQAYISGNWYQGGENNLNILGDVEWKCNLNQDVHPNWMFNNSIRYKVGVSTAHGDSLRNYMINEDNFLLSTQLGYKAVKHWYYSATMNFKTQFFNTYTTNTNKMKASFLSPGEVNVGLGMTYSNKSEHGERTFNLAIAPLSYNMKICRDIEHLNPTSFGIDAGHKTKHNFGSNIEAKWTINFTPLISWTSRLYAFTDYDYVQGDWEHSFSFNVTRHLSTMIHVHLRYDKSRPYDMNWKYWQFKELLSFGLTYRIATN